MIVIKHVKYHKINNSKNISINNKKQEHELIFPKFRTFYFYLLMLFELIELYCTYINNTEYNHTIMKKLRRQVKAMIQRRRDWVTTKGNELLMRSNQPKILPKKGSVRFQKALHQFISFFPMNQVDQEL